MIFFIWYVKYNSFVLSRSCGQYKVEAKQEKPEPGEEDPLHAGREERAIKGEPLHAGREEPAVKEEPEPGEEDPHHAGREERAIKEEPDDGGVLQLIDKLEDVAENLLTRLVST